MYINKYLGAIAGLIDYYGWDKFEPYTDCGLDLGWSHPNASAPPQWPEDDCYHTCNKGCPRGEMKSSFSWRLLMEPDKLDQNLEILYPGQGKIRAAAVDGRKEEDPSAFDASDMGHIKEQGYRDIPSSSSSSSSSYASASAADAFILTAGSLGFSLPLLLLSFMFLL